ncbi:hypothetical protein SH580_04560 [Coraliomargarita algicola]|uniref:Uncharacterized protein n=1 Tax=Coraliomargarita algicola TaxID=3092156 RepID=A0ABZ0RVI3_9BACT|nr:hypothetical protein [Coraliomargarita sp. J2-16]WPJ96979.1 hypothetical protein SH580_04560 [Coraliomargarita sp. J2-16]
MGHLIPAGTGLPAYRNLKIDTLGAGMEQLSPEEAAERIEGVALPTPEFNAEGTPEVAESVVPEADAIESDVETTETPDAEAS